MKKSPWVEEALRANPAEAFWQFYFRSHETKTEYVPRALLPVQLVTRLEEYVSRYRGILLGTRPDPGTLFFSRSGRPYDRKALTRIVGDITMKYGKVRVNSHLFRDIWAVKWLDDHPEDYLTVMKVLWHRKIDTSLKYAAGFDESHAAVRLEEWHTRRSA